MELSLERDTVGGTWLLSRLCRENPRSWNYGSTGSGGLLVAALNRFTMSLLI